MSQDVFNSIDPDLVGGVLLSEILNDFKDALMSGLSGTSRPSELDAGGTWIDTSTADLLVYKLFTGTADVTLFTVNTVTSSMSIQGSDDFFEVVKTSDDAVGPQLTLVKNRSTTNTKSGDVVGVINFAGKDDLGSRKVIGRIRYIAGGDVTSTNLGGGYFVIEGAKSGAGTASEIIRLIDGRVGIGVTAPTHTVHTRGVGARHERVAEDAVGVRVTRAKARTTNNGQSLNNDVIASDEHITNSTTGVEAIVAQDLVTATENHTDAARGVKREFKTVSKGSTALATRIKLEDDVIDMYGRTSVTGFERKITVFPSVSEVLSLDATTSFIEVSGVTPMLLKGIKSTSVSKSFYLYNATTQNIVIVNQSLDAVADDRIAVNGETSFTLQPGKSIEFVRRSSTNRWSPLVEGITGITYNEATQLLAKNLVSDVEREYLLPTTGSMRLDAYASYRENDNEEVSIGLYVESSKAYFITSTQYVVTTSNSLNEDVGYSTDWKDLDASRFYPGIASSPAAIAVKDGGSTRALIMFNNTTFKLDGFDNTSAWRGVSFAHKDSTVLNTYVCVASSGPTRIHRHGVVAPYSDTAYKITKSSAEITTPLYSVASGPNKFMAVGGPTPAAGTQGGAYLSTDAGATWTAKTLPDQLTTIYTKIRYINSNWYAVCDVAVVASNDDGTTWATVYSAPVGSIIKDFSYVGGVYVVTMAMESTVTSGTVYHIKMALSFDTSYWFLSETVETRGAEYLKSATIYQNRIHILLGTASGTRMLRTRALSFT